MKSAFLDRGRKLLSCPTARRTFGVSPPSSFAAEKSAIPLLAGLIPYSMSIRPLAVSRNLFALFIAAAFVMSGLAGCGGGGGSAFYLPSHDHSRFGGCRPRGSKRIAHGDERGAGFRLRGLARGAISSVPGLPVSRHRSQEQ